MNNFDLSNSADPFCFYRESLLTSFSKTKFFFFLFIIDNAIFYFCSLYLLIEYLFLGMGYDFLFIFFEFLF